MLTWKIFELIDKYKYIKLVLNKNSESFITHMAVFETKTIIYLLYIAQIAVFQ